jgi:maltose O-acetyltransferase
MKKFLKDLFVNCIAASFITPRKLRHLIYLIFGCKIKTKRINPGCVFYSNNVSVGEHTFINYRCIFDTTSQIEIGENCHIAQEVIFAGISHHKGNATSRGGEEYSSPIKIGNGCWIGARTTILPGVTIGNGTIIAAGAVVTKNCESNSLYVGVPARKIKSLTNI